ncbi:D-alanine--poly(phosphoribitol) ligase [Actinomadura opuntiae]|uniref:D-alanine--poly(phosphoribitol) ligase n=1 Tax=Actinomadura sp. OS1-43 TaxID=604315 RepID=UPI00255B3D88|nr:D-alanine--poly(phosphoribitol) ligase [Actinomadura sp. OS1-43]MDL4817267.1 D-alanine--poly(phosphoribitol) ligase [Actinomadura sp. OS1-43]
MHGSVENMRQFMLASAETTPDRPAVVQPVDGGFRIVTYRQLQRRVDDYAAALDGLGLDIGDRCILESDTTASAIAMFLACCTLGLTFVPVSPDTPAKRLMSIIGTTEPALHLQAATGRREGVPEHVGTARFDRDGLRVERPPAPRTRHRHEVTGTDTAYIIFTSGTTGRPKGVVMTHRAVVSFYRGMLQHGIVNADDRVATTSPLQFDFSLLDIGLALGSGAAVVPVPRDALPWPRRFMRLLREAEVTHVNGVPSIWRSTLRTEPDLLAGLDRLRGVLFCGEDFPLPELRHLQRLRPQARIVNCYGATESMACSFTDVPNPIPDDLERLSIGFAHPGAEMMIMDGAGHPIEQPGVVGEIHLRSPALFSGYWDDPQATAAALVPDPLDPRSGQVVLRTGDLAYRGEHGDLYFCGRADSQVQVRGNRVELGEIERRLLEFPGVAACAALLLPRTDEEPVLSAFLVMESQARAFDKMELRAFCMEALPGYMIPQELHVLDELPVTQHGKVDRTALAARFGAHHV